MRVRTSLILVWIATLDMDWYAHSVHALAQPPKPQIPNLTALAAQLAQTKLNYYIAVGSKEAPFQMKDMHVCLDGARQTRKADSTGIHEATLLQAPTYINRDGQQAVPLQHGGWEVVWSASSPHGHLACSFVSAERVQRNPDAALQAGRFFVYHRVWTVATLATERQRRKQIQSAAASYLEQRDQKLQTVADNEANVGDKVVSYAQAARSMNEYYSLGYKETLYIPLYDNQVIALTPECIVSTRGMVYKADDQRRMQYIGDSRVELLQTRPPPSEH